MSPLSTSTDWWSWLSKVQDDQRMERLERCRELEDVLKACETQSNYNPNTMEEFPGGLRRIKYFGWRGVLQKEAMPENLKDAIISSCARERHSVWACRAVSLGCGKELGSLKAGFDEQGPVAILYQPHTAYESSGKVDTGIPCAELQATLGSCVRQRGIELLERKQQQQQQQQ